MVGNVGYLVLEAYAILIGVNSALYCLDLLVYWILDCFRDQLVQYRIQKDRDNRHLLNHLEVILKNTIIMLIFFFLLVFPVIFWQQKDRALDQWPNLWELVWQNLVILVVDDFYFYWYHRLLHQRYFFQKIHHIHHRAHNPNILDFIYAHPLEPFFGSFGMVVCYLIMIPNLWTICMSIIIRHLHESEIHSGYFCPYSLTELCPFLISSKHHNLHHSRIKGNYANMFFIWDRIFGTQIEEKD